VPVLAAMQAFLAGSTPFSYSDARWLELLTQVT
jgi:hypothetical protein